MHRIPHPGPQSEVEKQVTRAWVVHARCCSGTLAVLSEQCSGTWAPPSSDKGLHGTWTCCSETWDMSSGDNGLALKSCLHYFLAHQPNIQVPHLQDRVYQRDCSRAILRFKSDTAWEALGTDKQMPSILIALIITLVIIKIIDEEAEP